METDNKEHTEPVSAGQAGKHPILHSQISQREISVSFYRCRKVQDHEKKDIQLIASHVLRSSAPFQLVEQVEGDSKILLLPIMDHCG